MYEHSIPARPCRSTGRPSRRLRLLGISKGRVLPPALPSLPPAARLAVLCVCMWGGGGGAREIRSASSLFLPSTDPSSLQTDTSVKVRVIAACLTQSVPTTPTTGMSSKKSSGHHGTSLEEADVSGLGLGTAMLRTVSIESHDPAYS